METPGLTSGLCNSVSNGGDIASLSVFNDTMWAATYFEGDYRDQYKKSFIVLRLLLQEIEVDYTYKIEIDRNNTLVRLTHLLTHSLTYSLTHSPTHSLTHSLRKKCVSTPPRAW